MKPTILFRKDIDSEEEFEIAKKYFNVVESRMEIKNSLVIPRYSALPFYKELENDLEYNNSKLINSYKQHKYIADFEYYYDIEDLTPKTYFKLDEVPEGGPYVVKGKTNSRKFDWNTMMFAKDRRRAIEVACDLRKDSMIQQQDIIVREFVPLAKVEEGVNGLPMSNEWRFFCLYDKILSYGFYWTIAEIEGKLEEEGYNLVLKVIEKVKDNVNFFVVDIAQKETGEWIVVELNDGQMSGLSNNDPDVLYNNLAALTQYQSAQSIRKRLGWKELPNEQQDANIIINLYQLDDD